MPALGGVNSTTSIATNPLTEPLDADGNAITGLPDPTDPQDAATMAYVDEATDGMAGPLLSFTIDLGAAEIATLSSVPVEIVAAPGAGKVIVPVAASFQFVAGAVAFDFDGVLTVGYPAATCLLGMGGAFDTLDPVLVQFVGQATRFDTPDAENQPLVVVADTEPDGAGDGTARLTVLYYVMDLAV